MIRPPHSILFILGAVSPADEIAVVRERVLLQPRDDFLRLLVHTSVILVCAATHQAPDILKMGALNRALESHFSKISRTYKNLLN